jgi:ubiquinone/menaquinone biosynthesis C-methylase UbiE
MNDSLLEPSKRIGALLLAAFLAAPGFLTAIKEAPRWGRASQKQGITENHGAEEGQRKKECAEAAKKEQQRAEAIKKVCQAVGIGLGNAVADIGCGEGVDTVTFAAVVGPTGKVYAEEIAPAALTNMIQKVRALKLDQVVPILGQSTNPCLPTQALDLEYMHFVFHHFAHPGDMLRQLWLGLKPGGLLVIVDREKGPLNVWVEDETREKKHNWTGETTVVRLARESGFLFEEALEDAWFEKEPFVLAFRKPAKPMVAPLDPDPALPFQPEAVVKTLGLSKGEHTKLAFVGLDQGRVLLPALQKRLGSGAAIYDVVIEEWATSTNEIPPAPPGVKAEVLRTTKGKLPPSADQLTYNAAIFADAYHRLWEPAKLLDQLHEKLPRDGWVVVLDRKGPAGEARRIAGHRRHIDPALVREDFARAGFELVRELKPPAPDRFLLRFRVRGG